MDDIKKKILDNSDSYNHLMNDNENLIKQLDNKINQLNKRINKLEKENRDILDSHHDLFNTLLIDYELTPRGVLASIQELDQELILFVDNVCRKHDLSYWLDYGSLLGAVRHGTFIPWDDDIDLSMMRGDFEKFYSVIEDELKANGLDKYIVVDLDRESLKNNFISFIQIKYKPYGTTIGFVDIFVYDFRKTDTLDADTYTKERNDFYYKMVARKDKAEIVREFMDNLNLVYEESDYIVPGAENVRGNNAYYKYSAMEKNMIFPLDEIRFKDITIPCPKDTDAYLKLIYNDYWNMPRIIRNHAVTDWVKKIDDIDNLFDESIKLLKDANNNFKF